MNIECFFNPKNVAVIGVSRNPKKFGHIIFSNFLDSGFSGKVYPVNPKADNILGERCYANINDIPYSIDLAIIAIPAKSVLDAVIDCVKKKVKACVILSAGFSEVGNKEYEEEIIRTAKGHMRIIGPNIIGIYDAYSSVDTVFNLRHRQERPKKGDVSFISQSGAFGAAILDWAASEGIGFSKFVSIGNRIDVDEVEVLDHLLHDRKTKIITLYLEGSRRPIALFKKLKDVTQKKPVITLKAGRAKENNNAVLSCTLADKSKIYSGMIKQAGAIEANTSEELFDFAKAFHQLLPSGKKVHVITDSSGLGVMAIDSILNNNLVPSVLSPASIEEIRKHVPKYATLGNPVYLTGDATSKHYEHALNIVLKDHNVDAVIIIMLLQISSLGSEIVDVVKNAEKYKKPIVVCTTGSEFTNIHKNIIEECGIPVYPTPERAAKALKALVEYSRYRNFGLY